MSTATVLAQVPFVIMEDRSDAGKKLRKQLLEWRSDVRLCQSIEEVRDAAALMDDKTTADVVFVLDIDMGENREREGLEAVAELEALRKKKDLPFYIAVLTSHAEFEAEATERGADVFLLKESHETDALELETRIDVRQAARISEQASRKQARLAEREYRQLKRRLQNVRKGRMEFLSNSVATISRALSWPLLSSSEQLILSMLNGPISRAHEQQRAIDPKMLDICIEGSDLLLRGASETEACEWAARIRRADPQALVPWLKGDDLMLVDDWEL